MMVKGRSPSHAVCLSGDHVQLCRVPTLARRLCRQYCFAPGAAVRAAMACPLPLPVVPQAHTTVAAAAASAIFHIVASLQ